MTNDIIERARTLDWDALEQLAAVQRQAQKEDGPDYLSGRAKLIQVPERHDAMTGTTEAIEEAVLEVEHDEEVTPLLINRTLGKARAAVRWAALASDNRRLLTSGEYEILTRAWRTVVGDL